MVNFQKLCLKWNNHSSNFIGNLCVVLSSEEYSDVTLCCQGEVWHLHQLVLSASSPHFAHLLRNIPSGQTPILILDGPTARDVHALVHFIYHGEVNVDQEALPSVLRTATTLRIKGLADVAGLTANVVPVDSNYEPNTTTIPSNDTDTCLMVPVDSNQEDVSPLNLSCNKDKIIGDIRKDVPEALMSSIESQKKENSHLENSTHDFQPSAKKMRTSAPIIPDLSADPTKKAEPLGSLPIRESELHNNILSKSTIPVSSDLPVSSNFVAPSINSVPSVPHLLCEEQAIEPVTSTACPYYASNGTVSYPMMNMPLSVNQTYQQSSTDTNVVFVQTNSNKSSEMVVLSPSVPEVAPLQTAYDATADQILNIKKNVYVQIPRQVIQPADGTPSFASFHSKKVVKECSTSSIDVNRSIEDESSLTACDASNSLVVTEKPFSHKKFSACSSSVQSYKKNIHRINKSNVHVSSTKIKMEINKDTPMQSDDEISSNDPASEITSSNVMATNSFTVPNFSSNISTVSTSTVVYSKSDCHQISSEITSQSTPMVNFHFKSGSNAIINEETIKISEVPSSNHVQETNEITDPNSVSTTQGTAVGNSNEGTSNNSQRVTVNMRTFKEEWKKQLLVDYDSRTNMSICMICFTTFKSYDGPRKNTYVKHAKRFHPALEEYSEEERNIIISMYEKYHKYDIVMQQEINKSFRTTNGPGNSLRRLKLSETVLSNSILTSNMIRVDMDNDSSEEKGDSGSESKSADECTNSKDYNNKEMVSFSSNVEKSSIQDTGLSINNNNLTENNRCKITTLSCVSTSLS